MLYKNYYNKISHLKTLLNHDFLVYKKCITNTSRIDCGRLTINISKKEKKVNTEKKILFNQPIKATSKDFKKCDKNEVKFLVGIDTGPDYFIERYIYRKFYSKYPNLEFFFFCGISTNETINSMIKDENKIYKDVIIFPFISSYYTSSITVVSEFKWIKKNCKKFKWYIHHQADVYININKTLNLLNTTNCNECAIGHIRVGEPIQRTKGNLYYLPEYLCPNKTQFPPYLIGVAIFFNDKTLQRVDSLIGKVHPQFWPDDLYLGLLFNHANITLIEIGLGYFYYNPGISLETAKYYYFVHDLYPVELYYLTKYLS